MSALQLGLFSPRWSAPVVERVAHRRAEIDGDPFLAAHAERLAAAGDRPLTFDEKTWDHAASGGVALDVELYRNFFLVCFKRLSDGKRLAFERSNRVDFDPADVERILNGNITISFNGLTYDLPVLYMALRGASVAGMKRASDQIIHGNVRPWDAEKITGVRVPRLNHIDLMEPNPSVRLGLKMLNGRLHGRYMVDLPFDPDAELTPQQMNVTTLYCHNDLDATELLAHALREPLTMRVALGKRYGFDFRSKSDAQMGEMIVKRRVERLTGRRLEGSPATASQTFGYEAPPFVSFAGEKMNEVLRELKTATFSVNSYGKIDEPPLLNDLKVSIGEGVYSMGIGGLHSTEAHRALKSDDERVLIDVDVASQYPSIIRNLGLYPKALGPTFLKVYAEMIEERLAAKAAGDKVTAEGAKIALNGVYGKLGSSYSILYAPHLLIATTLTGQLAILMLIERAELAGVPVVSANTDGVIFHCPRDRESTLSDVLSTWEADTGFTTERTRYAALYSSSVNSYLAIGESGKVKRKGPIADPWTEGNLRDQLQKNPQMTICSEAALRYLRDGIAIEDTVYQCLDPRMLVTVIRSTVGATWRGQHLGRAIRYYWSIDGEPILTKAGKKVPKTDGAKPLIELTDAVPPDVDHLRYCEETARLLVELGAV